MIIRFLKKMRSTYKTAEVIFISHLVFCSCKIEKKLRDRQLSRSFIDQWACFTDKPLFLLYQFISVYAAVGQGHANQYRLTIKGNNGQTGLLCTTQSLCKNRATVHHNGFCAAEAKS